MKKVHIILFATSLVFFLISCYKVTVPDGTPSCIRAKVRQLQMRKVGNPPASVWQYEYNDQIVYYIPSTCCDNYSDLYDENCKIICHPDGGLTGKGDGTCTDFFTKRKNGKLIWEDSRK